MEVEENIVPNNIVDETQPLQASAEENIVGVFQDQSEPLLGRYF